MTKPGVSEKLRLVNDLYGIAFRDGNDFLNGSEEIAGAQAALESKIESLPKESDVLGYLERALAFLKENEGEVVALDYRCNRFSSLSMCIPDFRVVGFEDFLDWQMKKIAAREGMFRLLDSPAERDEARALLTALKTKRRGTDDRKTIQKLLSQLNATIPHAPLVVGGGDFPDNYLVSATLLIDVERELGDIMRQEGNPFHIDTFMEDYFARQILEEATESANEVERLYLSSALDFLDRSGERELEFLPFPSSAVLLAGGVLEKLPCDKSLGFPAPLWDLWTKARLWWEEEGCHPDIISSVPLLTFAGSYATFHIFYNSNHPYHRKTAPMILDSLQWQQVVSAFQRKPARSAKEERQAIKRSAAVFGMLVAERTRVRTPPFSDAGAIAREPVVRVDSPDTKVRYAEDCINKVYNVVQLLWHLQQAGLLQFHHIDVPGAIAQSSVFFHFGNRIIQNNTGETFVIDAWVVETGREPVIAPELRWRRTFEANILTLDED